MKAVAAFLMRGRTQAAMVAVTLAALGLIFPPLAIGSSAVIGLVTLRNGPREAALVIAIALFAMGAFGALLLGKPFGLLAIGLGLWLPLLVLAYVLKTWRSLPMAVEAAVVGGFALVLVQYLGAEDPAAVWSTFLRELFGQMAGNGMATTAELEGFIDAIAPWMVGGIAATWALQIAAALFLARYWQALLYNPGGFREEFHALRLGRWLLILVVVLLLVSVFGGGPGIPGQLAMVGMAGFFLQGLALAHGLTAQLATGVGWLVGFYVILFIGLPHSFTAVSAAGYADGWFNFRARARKRKKPNGDE